MSGVYSNDIAPYTYPYFHALHGTAEKQGELQNLNIESLSSLHPLSKLAISDSFHDLAKPRIGYDPENFNSFVLKNIIAEATPNDDLYKRAVQLLYDGQVYTSSLEPNVNSYIETILGLQPAFSEITFDDLIARPVDFQEKINNSNGSLKITVPHPYKTFSEYLTKFSDEPEEQKTTYSRAQEVFATFIKEYLHNDNKEVPEVSTVQQIRFLFDAGANAIGKIFRYPGSGGIRYNAMACTADSASSSDEHLDPTYPKEYETIRNIDITSNYLSFDKYRIRFVVNDRCEFGKDGTSCFSVNFTSINQLTNSNNEILPPDYNNSARYFFGPKKNKSTKNVVTDEEPCGLEGASVSHIGKAFHILEGQRTHISQNNSFPQNIADILNQNYSSCIPIADSRFLKLIDGPITGNTITDLERLIVDYKRTGDYEQALTLRRAIENNNGNGNTGCYTYCSGDLLSTFFARLNGIPSIYQVGNNGTITLYRSDAHKGNPKERVVREMQMKAQQNLRAQEELKNMETKLLIFKYSEPLYTILEQLRVNYARPEIDHCTYIEIKNIYTQLRKVFVFVNQDTHMLSWGDPETEVADKNNDQTLLALNKAQRDLYCKILFGHIMKFFPTILNENKVIEPLGNVNKFTLPFLNLIVDKKISPNSLFYSKLRREFISCKEKIATEEARQQTEQLDKRQLRALNVNIARREVLWKEYEKFIAKVYNGIDPMNNYDDIQPMTGGRGRKKTTTRKNKKKKTQKTSRRIRGGMKRKLLEENETMKKMSHEILDVVNTVINSCNAYLKDLRGAVHADLSAVQKQAWSEQNTMSGGDPVEADWVLKFDAYSESSIIFLASLLHDFILSLEMLCHNFTIASTEVFKHFEVLSYILCLLTINRDYEAIRLEERKPYDYLFVIHADFNADLLNHTKNGGESISALVMTIFARVGYEMKNFHENDYYMLNPNPKKGELKKMIGYANENAYNKLTETLMNEFHIIITEYKTRGYLTSVTPRKILKPSRR